MHLVSKANFIIKFFIEKHGERIKPSVILDACKIILFKFNDIKFIDRLMYFNMPLSSLPKAYGFADITKGTFSHLFNILKNQSYRGPLPPAEMFSLDTMKENAREDFCKW